MTWSQTPIDGQQSVAANKTPINNAFSYIGTTMQEDHYWNPNNGGNSNLDGHHQFVQMDKFGGATPANPTLATGMNGVYFLKDKTSGDAPDLQIAEPHYMCYDGSNNQILQLGFRAMANFTVSGGSVTEKYIHNCSIARNDVGIFTLTFDTALPTANYIVFGSAQRTGNSNQLYLSVTTPTTASCKIQFQYSGNDVRDPTIAMVAICGG